MDKRIYNLQKALQALADPTRLRMVGLLAGGEVCVCHIHDALQIPQPKASRHLAYLRAAGLVETRREGLWVHYRLAEPEDASVRTVLNAAVHTLGHIPASQADEKRLPKHVTRTRSRPARRPILACCGG